MYLRFIQVQLGNGNRLHIILLTENLSMLY